MGTVGTTGMVLLAGIMLVIRKYIDICGERLYDKYYPSELKEKEIGKQLEEWNEEGSEESGILVIRGLTTLGYIEGRKCIVALVSVAVTMIFWILAKRYTMAQIPSEHGYWIWLVRVGCYLDTFWNGLVCYRSDEWFGNDCLCKMSVNVLMNIAVLNKKYGYNKIEEYITESRECISSYNLRQVLATIVKYLTMLVGLVYITL